MHCSNLDVLMSKLGMLFDCNLVSLLLLDFDLLELIDLPVLLFELDVLLSDFDFLSLLDCCDIDVLLFNLNFDFGVILLWLFE